MSKIDKYTKLAAQDARTRGVRGNIFSLMLGPPVAFSRSFFLRAGFLDGLRGFTIAYTGARYVFLRQLRILRPWK